MTKERIQTLITMCFIMTIFIMCALRKDALHRHYDKDGDFMFDGKKICKRSDKRMPTIKIGFLSGERTYSRLVRV